MFVVYFIAYHWWHSDYLVNSSSFFDGTIVVLTVCDWTGLVANLQSIFESEIFGLRSHGYAM